MKRIIPILFAVVLAACAGSKTGPYEGYAEQGPINNFSSDAIQQRQIDLVNAIRSENGMNPVQLSAELTGAGLTQAHDMAAQQRAWNFGSDKSTPQQRAERSGFFGVVTGENVSETYRGELQVLQQWLSNPVSRQAILNPHSTHIGIAYHMESSGKVWWVQNFGAAGLTQTSSGN